MLSQRVIVALVVGPVLLVAAYFGGWVFFGLLTALLVVACIEYRNILLAMGRNVALWILLPAVVLMLAASHWFELGLMGLIFTVSIFVGLIISLWGFERQRTTDAALDWFALVLGIVLFGWVAAHFFLLRNVPETGWKWVVLAMLAIWMADIGGFLVGSLLAGKVIGRHALSPRLSPKKTVEGYVGGIVAATLTAAATGYFLDLPIWLAVAAGLAVGVLGLVGDLSISLLKREAGVKDSGKLFPGHGGALDRLDSLIWAAAIVYYLVLYLGPLA